MFRGLIAAAFVVLTAGCQTTKPANDIVVEVGPDGTFRVVSAGNSKEDQMLAALMQSALDGELDTEEEKALAEDEVWRADAAGNLTHIQSGGQCPLHWGDYVREHTNIFNPDGMDVGCNYTGPGGKIMTFYFYQSGDSLADEADSVLKTMKTRQPISTETPFGGTQPSRGYVARTLAYETADGTKMRTSVLLTNGGGWRLKVRLTCQADGASLIENEAGIALIGQADRLASTRPLAPAEKPAPI